MKTINYTELTKMLEPGKKHPILVNVLPKKDFLNYHIPGSINIPVEQLGQKANELFAKHDWVVVYCAGEKCDASHKAAETLHKAGFENIFRFVGGVEEWKKNKNYVCCETKTPTACAA